VRVQGVELGVRGGGGEALDDHDVLALGRALEERHRLLQQLVAAARGQQGLGPGEGQRFGRLEGGGPPGELRGALGPAVVSRLPYGLHEADPEPAPVQRAQQAEAHGGEADAPLRGHEQQCGGRRHAPSLPPGAPYGVLHDVAREPVYSRGTTPGT